MKKNKAGYEDSDGARDGVRQCLFRQVRDPLNRDRNGGKVSQAKTLGKSGPDREQQETQWLEWSEQSGEC